MTHPILIADIEESTREALKLILANHSSLIVVESQAHALEILSRQNNITLVFMGLHNEDGINTDVFADIHEKLPKLTVIAVGDYKSETHALEAVRQGATGYMIKPFKAEEVIATTRQTTQE
ncbi:MAG: response regulator [Candidatus Omnitrophica bacterium]|nr:response regulator [Candidatus Omnitrophota bacterium]